MNSRSNDNGLVLVAVLWIIVLMTALVAVVSQGSRLNLKMTTAALDETRCKWACRAGTEIAIGLLNEDLRDTDSLLDLWSDNDEDFNDVQMEGCSYRVRVTDEAGKLNVNVATKEQLMALPYMTPEIVDAILDWRDDNESPRAEGAETGYYENLAYPYTMRNGPLRTIRELLRVKGVTKDLLYGEDTNLNGQLDYPEMDGEQSPPLDNGDEYLDEGWIAYLTCHSYEKNVDATGQKRVNINQANERQLQNQLGLRPGQAKWITQNRGGGFKSVGDLVSNKSPKKANKNSKGGSQDNAEPIDLETFGQIVDKITISNDAQLPGKVNINTAPREVLVALMGGGDEAERLAETIVSERSSQLYGYQTIADLMKNNSMQLKTFKSIANHITVRSDVFTVRTVSAADVSGAKVQTEAVVDRGQRPCTILYWYQGANY